MVEADSNQCSTYNADGDACLNAYMKRMPGGVADGTYSPCEYSPDDPERYKPDDDYDARCHSSQVRLECDFETVSPASSPPPSPEPSPPPSPVPSPPPSAAPSPPPGLRLRLRLGLQGSGSGPPGSVSGSGWARPGHLRPGSGSGSATGGETGSMMGGDYPEVVGIARTTAIPR